MQSIEAWLVPLLFLLIFPAFWAAICFLLSLLSGWRGLVRYRGRLSQVEGSVSMASGGMGLTSYRGVLNVAVGPEGLGLSLFPLFAVGTPPLAIPWPAVTVHPPDRMLGMFDRLRLDVDGVRLVLYGAAARLVAGYCARRLPQPETPALSTQHLALSTWHSAPGTQHLALSTCHSAPATQHLAPRSRC